MENITIRKTEESDGEKIKAWLMDEEVLKGFPMIDQREVDDSVRFWMDYAKKGSSLTAELGGEICGCANLYIHAIEKLKHQTLFVILVDKKFRGQGIGTRLIQALTELARDTFKIELLHLEVYTNNPAISLYQRLGFVEYGRHPKYLKEPDGTYYDKIVMQKSLLG